MKRILTILSLVASLSMADSGPLGLVLSGGGAKGAYEVGVWKALSEVGLTNRIAAISGTSVGSINAALFAAVGDSGSCAALWENEIGKAFQFNTNLVVKAFGEVGRRKVEQVYSRMRENIEADKKSAARKRGCAVSELPPEVVLDIEEECAAVAQNRLIIELPKWKAFSYMLEDFDETESLDGFLSSEILHSLVVRTIPNSFPKSAPAVYATALRKKRQGVSFSAVRFSLAGESPDRHASMICASTCIPFVFGSYGIDGETYIDGGFEKKGGDNVPLAPILENHPDIKTVVVVFLENLYDNPDLNKKKRQQLINQIARNEALAQTKGVELISIIPSENIGGAFGGWQGVFDASPETAKHLIELGRKDARKKLREAGLAE